MKKQQIHINYTIYENLEETPSNIQTLITQTQTHLKNAYAPYSEFKVAAAVVLNNQEIVFATNQENAAYPSGLCAERTALFYAKSKFPNQQITQIIIVTEKNFAQPATPCGACRQVINEYELNQATPIEIILYSGSQVWQFASHKLLLPFSFSGKNLKH